MTTPEREAPALTPPALLDQIDTLQADATNPAPWHIDGNHRFDVLNAHGSTVAEAAWAEDAVLIAAAVNALPHLTAALRATLAKATELDEFGAFYDRENTTDDPAMAAKAAAYLRSAHEVREAIAGALSSAHPMNPAAPTNGQPS